MGKIVVDRGELHAREAEQLFGRLGVKQSHYDVQSGSKQQGGVWALVRVCQGQVGNWSRLLSYTLWADRTTHSSVTGFMPA